jgi:hypothetical protein
MFLNCALQASHLFLTSHLASYLLSALRLLHIPTISHTTLFASCITVRVTLQPSLTLELVSSVFSFSWTKWEGVLYKYILLIDYRRHLALIEPNLCHFQSLLIPPAARALPRSLKYRCRSTSYIAVATVIVSSTRTSSTALESLPKTERRMSTAGS